MVLAILTLWLCFFAYMFILELGRGKLGSRSVGLGFGVGIVCIMDVAAWVYVPGESEIATL